MFDFISKEIMAWKKVIIVWYQISVILFKVRHGIQLQSAGEKRNSINMEAGTSL